MLNTERRCCWSRGTGRGRNIHLCLSPTVFAFEPYYWWALVSLVCPHPTVLVLVFNVGRRVTREPDQDLDSWDGDYDVSACPWGGYYIHTGISVRFLPIVNQQPSAICHEIVINRDLGCRRYLSLERSVRNPSVEIPHFCHCEVDVQSVYSRPFDLPSSLANRFEMWSRFCSCAQNYIDWIGLIFRKI
jgi:hypothetical protein